MTKYGNVSYISLTTAKYPDRFKRPSFVMLNRVLLKCLLLGHEAC